MIERQVKKPKTPAKMKASILKKWAKLTKKVREYNEAKNGNG